MNFWEWIASFSVIVIPLFAVLLKKKLSSSGRRVYFCEQVINTGLFILIGLVPLIIDVRGYNQGLIKTTISEIVIFTMIISWMIKSFEERHFLLRRSTLDIPLLVFLWAGIVSFMLSSYKYASIKQLYAVVTYVLMFFIIMNNVKRCKINQFLFVLLGSGAVVSIYGILQSYGYDFLNWESGGRSISFLGNPNFLSGYLVMVLPICLAVFFSVRSIKSKVLCMVIFLCMVMCLTATLTRSSLVAFLSGMVLFSFLLIKRKAQDKKAFAYGIVMCVLILAVFVTSASSRFFSMKGRSSTIVSSVSVIAREIPELILRPYGFSTQAEENIGVRMTIWQTAYRMFLRYPVFGAGIGTLRHHAPEFRPSFFKLKDFGRANVVMHAHSEYLEILAEQGITGLLVFTWVIVSFFVCAWKYLKNIHGQDFYLVAGGCCAFFSGLIDNMVSVSLRWTSNAIIFWFIISFVTLLASNNLREKIPSELGNAVKVPRIRKPLIYIFFILLGIFFWGNAVNVFVSDIHMGRARRSIEQFSRSDASIEECKAALRYDPVNISALYVLGYSYSCESNLNEARFIYEKLLCLSPGYAQADYNLGIVYYRLGLLDLSIKYLKRAIDLDAVNYEAYYMIGLCYSMLNDWENAMDSFKKAIHAKKILYANLRMPYVYPMANYQIGSIYNVLDQKKEALKYYQYVLDEMPGDSDTIKMINSIKR